MGDDATRAKTGEGPEPGRGGLTHLDEAGRARMVDVGDKPITEREAVAVGSVRMDAGTLEALLGGALAKGDALAVARLAGIMATKRTGDLIPLCHPLGLTHASVEFAAERADDHGRLWIRATARCVGRTGVEMEAMTAVSVAGLTLYDMAKARDRGMVIEGVTLWHKRGGRSGDFTNPSASVPSPDLPWR